MAAGRINRRPHERGFFVRLCVAVFPGQTNVAEVAVLTKWPQGRVPLYQIVPIT